jgi:GMP synthase PP-ATPase subunit
MEPVDIDNVQLVDNKNVCVEYDFLSDIINQEIIDLINNNLDVNLRTDFLKILHGVYLPKHKRDIIENKIREILDEYDRE